MTMLQAIDLNVDGEEGGKRERLQDAMARRVRVRMSVDGKPLEGVCKRWIGRGTMLVIATAEGPVEVPLGRVRALAVYDDAEPRRLAALMMSRKSLVRIRTCDGQPPVSGIVIGLKWSSFVVRDLNGASTLRAYGAVTAIDELGAAPVTSRR